MHSSFMASQDNPSYTTLKRRVQKGAKWLDTQIVDWADAISVEDLDMFNPECCILGQLWGNMYSKTDRMKWGDFEIYMFGFDVFSDNEQPLGQMLTELWVEEIQARCRQYAMSV